MQHRIYRDTSRTWR